MTGIRLDKTSLVMEGGDTYTLTATVNPDTAYNKDVTWSSSDESVATVSETGVVTALQKGTATIAATAQDGSGVSGTCRVTVNSTMHLVKSPEELQSKHPYENNTNEVWVYTLAGVESLKVTFSSDTAVDEDYDFIYLYDGAGREIGKYTGGELAGKTIEIPGDTVRIKLVTDEAITGYGFQVDSVVPGGTPIEFQSISLNHETLSLSEGDKAVLQVVFHPENTTADRKVTWSSSDETVAIVEKDGTVTAVGEGKCAITAEAAGKTAVCQMTVVRKAAEEVEEKIVLHYQDGTGRTEEVFAVHGKPMTILKDQVPIREGWLFVGWYTQPDGQGEHVTQDTILTDQRVLYACWRQVKEGFWVQPVGDQMYTGKALKPEVFVYDGDTLLQEKQDYTISYKNNIKANDASNAQTAPTIIVKGKGNYSGKMEVPFRILPQNIKGTDFTIDPMAAVYNAKKCRNRFRPCCGRAKN
ncbi:MAG: Ig-like domain-containing protein [Muribaculum sp.]|nr:Ig-like domain-containing protein [Muribaculum sp.]